MAAHKAQTTLSALKQAESLCNTRGTRLTEKRRQVLTGFERRARAHVKTDRKAVGAAK